MSGQWAQGGVGDGQLIGIVAGDEQLVAVPIQIIAEDQTRLFAKRNYLARCQRAAGRLNNRAIKPFAVEPRDRAAVL